MTNKIGDPSDPMRKPPELNPQQPRKVEAVEKISETDPDQQARQRKFRGFMEDEDAAPSSSLGPSPFDPSFHRTSEGSYNYTPIEKDLPSSSSFLAGPGDLHSPDHPLHVEEEKSKKKGKKFQHEYPLFSKVTPRDVQQEETKKTKPDPKEKSSKRKDLPPAMYPTEEKSPWSPVKHLEKDQKKKESEISLGSVAHIPSHKGKQEKIQKELSPLEQETPLPSFLPHEAIQFAEQSTIHAVRYLAPETEVLYTTMVGNIYCYEKTNSGIATTEISLTSPAFVNSRFFGATITLEKYDTDPSSFNIRLTGSNEAVTLFNQNIKNLYAAFQNGNFRFRIGRLEAEYSVEKPLFHRKETAKGKDMGSKDQRPKQ